MSQSAMAFNFSSVQSTGPGVRSGGIFAQPGSSNVFSFGQEVTSISSSSSTAGSPGFTFSKPIPFVEKLSGAPRTIKSEPSHADLVLSSLRNLREQDIVQDFTIDVGGESFKVHRAVLAACSQYFRAMFSHDTKERQESAVGMEGVDASAVRECIDFMYSGEANVTVDSAGDILHAASIMQLERLTKSCFEKIEESLDPENCLDIAEMLEIYPCEQLQRKVENCIRKYFKDVINAGKFKIKSVEKLKSFVSEFSKNDDEIWGAIKSWLGHDEGERNQYFDELLSLVKLDEFPSAVLLQSIINDSLIKEFPERFDIFIKRLFSSTEELTDNLTIKNCFIVKRFANEHDHITKEASNIINNFFINNFEQVLIQEDFVNLAGSEVLMILRASNVEYLASEELRWNAVMKWVKHNSKRTQLLPELLKTVDFSQFKDEFMQDTVRQEPLLKNSPECISALMDNVFNQSDKCKKTFECVAVLSRTGEISGFRVDAEKSSLSLPGTPSLAGASSEIFSFNGKLCFFDGGALYFFGKKNWVRKSGQSIPEKSTIAVVKDKIYFVSSTKTYVYDALTDQWNQNLPGCKFDGGVAVLDSNLHVFGSQGIKVLATKKKRCQWISNDGKETPNDGKASSNLKPNCSVVAFMGNIYAVAPGSSNLWIYSPLSDKRLKIIDQIPGPSPDHVCLFVANNKLILLSVTTSNESLYAYDHICKGWLTMKIVKVVQDRQPAKFGCATLPAQTNNKKASIFDRPSACSFRREM